MSLGRLNNPLYDEQGQFIGNQQPEANMFYGFNPTGAIGTGVSSGNIPAVANPLDSAPAGGGKGGGKGGGFTPPPPQNMYGGVGYNTYMGAGGIRPTSTPAFTSGFTSPAMTPSQGKGGGKGGGTPPPAPAGSVKGGGKGGGMPTGARYDRNKSLSENMGAGMTFAGTAPDGSFNPPTSYGSPSVSTVSNAASALGQALGGGNAGGPEGPPPPSNIADAAFGLTNMNFGGPYGSAPAPAGGGKGGGKGGGVPDYMKEYAGSIGQPRTPPAGGGMFSGLANAANLLNQQRQRNDFISSDNELNAIKAEQMELERKARQEAKNRSYYGQPAEPTVAQQPAQMVDPVSLPVSYDTYMENFNNPEANMFYGLAHPRSREDFEALSPEERLKAATFGGMASLPASRNPYDRGGISERDRLDMAYRNRISQMGFDQPNYGQQQLKFLEEMTRGTSRPPQPSIGAGLNTSGLAALAMGGGNPFMR